MRGCPISGYSKYGKSNFQNSFASNDFAVFRLVGDGLVSTPEICTQFQEFKQRYRLSCKEIWRTIARLCKASWLVQSMWRFVCNWMIYLCCWSIQHCRNSLLFGVRMCVGFIFVCVNLCVHYEMQNILPCQIQYILTPQKRGIHRGSGQGTYRLGSLGNHPRWRRFRRRGIHQARPAHAARTPRAEPRINRPLAGIIRGL